MFYIVMYMFMCDYWEEQERKDFGLPVISLDVMLTSVQLYVHLKQDKII